MATTVVCTVCGKPGRLHRLLGQVYRRCGECMEALYSRIAEGN